MSKMRVKGEKKKTTPKKQPPAILEQVRKTEFKRNKARKENFWMESDWG